MRKSLKFKVKLSDNGIIIIVMNKRKLHYLWKRLNQVSYWYFFIFFLVWAVVAVFALRQNNLTAIKLRDQVSKTDQANGDTEKALKNLRIYVYSHMNTDLATSSSVYPPIQLKYRHERLVKAEQERVDAVNSHSNIYNDAQKYCEATQPQSFYGAGRLPCIQSYLDSHSSPPIAKPSIIPDAEYKFNFISPTWSPDLAGWSMVLAIVGFGVFILSFLADKWLIYQFKKHNWLSDFRRGWGV